MIKAILVDDLPDALFALEELLKLYCPEVEVVGKEKNILSAYKLINKIKPDLIFLDINMPGGSGFDLLDLTQDRLFKVIFTTAHEKHAVKAIKTQPLDYLLKPIDPDELRAAVDAYLKLKKSELQKEKLERKIRFSSHNELQMINTQQILYIEADGRYSKIHLENMTSRMMTKNLGDFEIDLADDPDFFRINRSFIINLQHLKRVIREDGGYVEMTNGKKIEISKIKKEKFLEKYTGSN